MAQYKQNNNLRIHLEIIDPHWDNSLGHTLSGRSQSVKEFNFGYIVKIFFLNAS